MLTRRIIMAAMALCLCCSGTMAVQNLNSATGYVQLPDAAVTAKGTIDVSGTYVLSNGTNELSALGGLFPCHGTGWNARVLGGVFDRFELGAGYLSIDKTYGEAHAFTVAGKFQVYNSCDNGVAVAVGANYRNWSNDMALPISLDKIDVDLPATISAYLAVDKTWKTEQPDDWQATTTLGVIYDNYDHSQQQLESGIPFFIVPPGVPISDTGKVQSKNFVNPFFGVKLAKNGWTLMGEYKPRLRSNRFTYESDLWSAAVRKEMSGRWAATAGVTNFNLPYAKSEPGFFFDLSYKFGK